MFKSMILSSAALVISTSAFASTCQNLPVELVPSEGHLQACADLGFENAAVFSCEPNAVTLTLQNQKSYSMEKQSSNTWAYVLDEETTASRGGDYFKLAVTSEPHQSMTYQVIEKTTIARTHTSSMTICHGTIVFK